MDELSDTIKTNIVLTLSLIEFTYTKTCNDKSYQGLVLKELQNETKNLGDRVNIIIRKFEIDLEYMNLSPEVRKSLSGIIESYKKHFFFETYRENLKAEILNNSVLKEIIKGSGILGDIFDNL